MTGTIPSVASDAAAGELASTSEGLSHPRLGVEPPLSNSPSSGPATPAALEQLAASLPQPTTGIRGVVQVR